MIYRDHGKNKLSKSLEIQEEDPAIMMTILKVEYTFNCMHVYAVLHSSNPYFNNISLTFIHIHSTIIIGEGSENELETKSGHKRKRCDAQEDNGQKIAKNKRKKKPGVGVITAGML